MAIVNIARGGQPDFKGWMCRGEFAEYGPAYDAEHQPGTPPFDSHAEAAWDQGFLTVGFPLVPRILETTAHHWMSNALKNVTANNDILITNWLPYKSYLDSLYIEVAKTDAALTGMYIKPVAVRVAPDFSNPGDYTWTEISDYATAINAAGFAQLPLGTPVAPAPEEEPPVPGDTVYGVIKFANDGTEPPLTFGHNIMRYNASGDPVSGFDSSFGVVALGFKFTGGSADQFKLLPRANFAVYLSGKLLQFDCPGQIG